MRKTLIVNLVIAISLLLTGVAGAGGEKEKPAKATIEYAARGSDGGESPRPATLRGRFPAVCSRSGDRPPKGNQPPNVRVEIGAILPNRIDVRAHESDDPDGHIQHFLFHLEDFDTGDPIAYATTFREPTGDLVGPGILPPKMRLRVTALDNDGGLGTASVTVSLEPLDTCSSDEFTCSRDSSNVVCVPNGDTSTTNSSVTMSQLLRAAHACEGSLDANSTLVIQAAGGQGGGMARTLGFPTAAAEERVASPR